MKPNSVVPRGLAKFLHVQYCWVQLPLSFHPSYGAQKASVVLDFMVLHVLPTGQVGRNGPGSIKTFLPHHDGYIGGPGPRRVSWSPLTIPTVSSIFLAWRSPVVIADGDARVPTGIPLQMQMYNLTCVAVSQRRRSEVTRVSWQTSNCSPSRFG